MNAIVEIVTEIWHDCYGEFLPTAKKAWHGLVEFVPNAAACITMILLPFLALGILISIAYWPVIWVAMVVSYGIHGEPHSAYYDGLVACYHRRPEEVPHHGVADLCATGIRTGRQSSP